MEDAQGSSKSESSILLIIGVLLVSFSLRPSITSVGPLIPLIREDLNLSNAWSGFLTTLPLLTFATFSLFASTIGDWLGISRAVLWGLILTGLGLFIRVQGGVFLLYFGTGLTGIGIVICNVLLIPLIKIRMPNRLGLMTSLFTTGMSLFAAIGSGVSVPLALDLGLGWRGSLLSWIILILVTILFWIPQLRKQKTKSKEGGQKGKSKVWKSRLAWQVSLYMGIQSMIYFTLIAWLPDLLISKGFTVSQAGLILSLMQIIGLLGAFLSPLIAVRYKEQVKTAVGLGVGYILGFATLFTHQSEWIYAGLVLVGICLGASISLVYTLISLRSEGENTAGLSGMAQSTGYYLAALGPVLMGGLFDLFGEWNLLVVILIVCAIGIIYLGTKVGRDVKV
ncbi:MFS transporter [Echinicola jeungdonensis]|uniref:CynX/NimT family MFS transporter n=1 Tax=Echinicola jeungdonensis TaxID=709343 RepID=A0ABV5J370_9BACT|nr:MFS transporter [Echinicola jeungdonensis]MDN3668600.1 MFS transporter [Echinicola jeungdonensis]